MGLGITVAGLYTGQAAASSRTGKKPVWNPNRVYNYLEDMNQGFQDYKKQAVAYYSAQIEGKEGNGVLTEEELKAEIKELFPEYTLTGTEPSDVVQGKFYLYIDSANLKKMASDPAYRAKVYGLMDSEIQGKKGYTLKYSDGRNVTSHLTGSIFSLAEKNGKYAGADGIPYRGSCTSDHSFSTSQSHPQVRSMSFLYDHIDPAKSAARDRKANAAKAEAERIAKKKAAKKEEEERLEKKREEKREKKLEEEEKALQLLQAARQMGAGGRYKSAEDFVRK